MIDKKTSNRINILKTFSIFSVICAHCNTVGAEASRANSIVHFLLNALGTIGVGCFFVVSGYLFTKCRKEDEGFKSFFIKKAKRLLVPWLLCGTIVWLYVVLRKGGVTIDAWVKFLLGYQSYLYFIPVLFILYLIFWFIEKNKYLVLLGVIFSIISNVLTYINILPWDWAAMNIFNWFLYFAVGSWLAANPVKRIAGLEMGGAILSTLTLVAISILEQYLIYWTPGFLVFEMITLIGLVWCADCLGNVLPNNADQWMDKISQWTLAIYLLHMPVAGIVASVCMRWDIWILTLLRPWIVFGITLGALLIYNWFCEKVFKHAWMKVLVGLK